MPKILIDGDGCPIINECIKAARDSKFELYLYCDSSHDYHNLDIEIIVVDQGLNSADFKIITDIVKGDIVLTNDYGLASLALCKNAIVCDFNGQLYTEFNIMAKLSQRHDFALMRKQGIKTANIKKRKASQNILFYEALQKLIADN